MKIRSHLEIQVRLSLDTYHLEFSETLSERVTGLFGPSGSGKTSLLETIAGLRREATGRIVFGDTVWLDSAMGIFVPPEKRGIGYVPQNGLLFPHVNVRQNLLFGVGRGPFNQKLFDCVVETLGLAGLLDRKPNSLSGGERQRVAVGRAVCSGPKLLVLDEPLSALHHSLRYSAATFLTRFSNEANIPILWVSHDPIEVQSICHELIAIENGKRVTRGQPRDVLTTPDVFQSLEQTGFQNVLRCKIVSVHKTETLVRLTDGDSQMTLSVCRPNADAKKNDDVLITIPARSILIATENLEHVSARNILCGQINALKSLACGIKAVEIRLIKHEELPLIVAEVTDAACQKLSLQSGQMVNVLVKSTACTLQTAKKDQTTVGT